MLCHDLISRFWDGLYPPLEDGDAELRAAPLDWVGTALEEPLKHTPLVRAGYDWFKFKESKLVGYEEHAQTDLEKKARAKMIAAGKLAPEAFDKAFVETPKAFYLQSEKDLDACLKCPAEPGRTVPGEIRSGCSVLWAAEGWAWRRSATTCMRCWKRSERQSRIPWKKHKRQQRSASRGPSAAAVVGGVSVAPAIVIPLASSEPARAPGNHCRDRQRGRSTS